MIGRMKYAVIVCLFFTQGVFAETCPIAKKHDVRQIEYRFEKLAGSYRIRLEFPQLSKSKCTERQTNFGTLWEFAIGKDVPSLKASAFLNGALVQEWELRGEFWLKTTPQRTTISLFNAMASKPILDHEFLQAEIEGEGDIIRAPFIQVDLEGQRRHFPAQVETY